MLFGAKRMWCSVLEWSLRSAASRRSKTENSERYTCCAESVALTTNANMVAMYRFINFSFEKVFTNMVKKYEITKSAVQKSIAE